MNRIFTTGKAVLLHSIFAITLIAGLPLTAQSQHSVARVWNEVLLESIRNDFARPTVHARNLFHFSAVMYDAWAAYGGKSDLYFLGDTTKGCPFTGITIETDIQTDREKAISYAVYRLLRYRFQNSPGIANIHALSDSVFYAMGYDSTITSTNYSLDGPAALGNYIAACMITYGQSDGSNELGSYANTYYGPLNPTLLPDFPGNPDILYPNFWQPLTLQFFVDQAGNPLPINTPPFLSPEWGIVETFALSDSMKTDYFKGPDLYPIYYDPGAPAYIDTANGGPDSDFYKWSFNLTAIWSSHLDPADSVVWDMSPGNNGNITTLPTTYAEYLNFYNLIDGGVATNGHTVNPVTGQPYAPNIVYRGDYTRVLAEFWADGPDSETPPGHWFTILNYVNDHSMFKKRWKGEGPELDELEWDVRAYLSLGGTMHDVAISVWGCKGYYDYIRPISAIRYMADQGQSTDTTLSNYNKNGIPLHPGVIEVVMSGDSLEGDSAQHVGKIKIKCWRGPDYIPHPDTTAAGVGWILVENWWPYQRPTFVTPPFAGYVSGHSTFSRAAAELMTDMTGSNFFPGGMGEFPALKDEFLVFEQGPSKTVTLQWATYQDASDECSLSRIWGGIHPPMDDIPGRFMGMAIEEEVFDFIEDLFNSDLPVVYNITAMPEMVGKADTVVAGLCIVVEFDQDMDTSVIPSIAFPNHNLNANLTLNSDSSGWTNDYTYAFYFDVNSICVDISGIDVQIAGAQNMASTVVDTMLESALFDIYIQNEIDLTGTNVNCFNGSDGSIDVSMLDGKMPFSYLWSNGSTLEDLNGIPAGTYTVTVTDDNGCLAGGTVVVTQPSSITVTSAKNNISCNNQNNGNASVFVSGGVAEYSYLWSNGSTASAINGLAGGSVTCTVTDANACSSSVMVTIFNPSALLAFNIKDNPGPGDLNLLVSGGINPYSYNWSNGVTTEDLFGLAPGFYFCQISDNNGCAKISTATMTAPPPARPAVSEPGNVRDEAAFRIVDLFPNPNNGNFTLTLSSDDRKNLSLSMFDNLGRNVYFSEIQTEKGLSVLNIDISHLSDGVYILRIGDDNNMETHKIMHFK